MIIFPGTKQPIDETLCALPSLSVCTTGDRLVGIGLAVTRQEGDVEQLAYRVAYLHEAGRVVTHAGPVGIHLASDAGVGLAAAVARDVDQLQPPSSRIIRSKAGRKSAMRNSFFRRHRPYVMHVHHHATDELVGHAFVDFKLADVWRRHTYEGSKACGQIRRVHVWKRLPKVVAQNRMLVRYAVAHLDK